MIRIRNTENRALLDTGSRFFKLDVSADLSAKYLPVPYLTHSKLSISEALYTSVSDPDSLIPESQAEYGIDLHPDLDRIRIQGFDDQNFF
jgi:hypothetical protein